MKFNYDKECKSFGLDFAKWKSIWFYPWNDWPQFFTKGWNWKSFNFLHIYFEDDVMMGGYDFECVVLGLGFRIRINWRETKTTKELDAQIEDIKAGTSKGIPWDRIKDYANATRMGQKLFNFFEWLHTEKNISSEQSDRMGDPFNLTDEEFFKYYDEYNKGSKMDDEK